MTTTGNSFVATPKASAAFLGSNSIAAVPKADSAASNQSFSEPAFADRRRESEGPSSANERRQFGNSHQGLSDDGRELALAIDRYKLENHRRYLTCDEMISVLGDLGYAKTM